MDFAALRRKYGSVFVTAITNGQTIPWKPLNMAEFLEYSELFQSEKYARATLEDEIFKKCVVDELMVDRMSRFPAGIITSVVSDILKNSGPETIPELNYGLGISRVKARQALHETASLIAQAFPAYTLEQVYELEYPVFLLRLAQAEAKLLRLGVLQEGITFEDPQAVQQEQAPTPEKVEHRRPQASELADMIERRTGTEYNRTQRQKTIITNSEVTGSESLLLGHEKEDQLLLRNEMLEDAKTIYKGYFDQLDEGSEVDIQSPEERLQAANKRAELNKSAFDTAVKQKQKEEKELLENIAKAKKRKAAKNK